MSLLENAPAATPDTGTTPPPAADAGSTPATPDTSGTPGTDPAPTPPIQSDWYYDENLKGNGTKPDWFKDNKYKSVTDQAKAYTEVEKKLGAFKGAPEKYDLTLPEHPEVKFADDDPMLKEFLANAKKNGVSQEYVSELLGTYAQALTANVPDTEAEMKKLGPNAAQDLQILSQWASSQFTPEEFEVFKGKVTTAADVRFFDKVRMMATQAEVAAPGPNTVHRESEEEVKQLIMDERYNKDPAFREDVRRRLALAMSGKRK